MKPFERPLDADVQEELDRLEAALNADPDADPTLSALVADVRAARPTLDADARERIEERARAAADGARKRPTGTRAPGGFGRRRRLVLAVAAVVAVAVPVAGVILNEAGTTVVSDFVSGNLDPDVVVVDENSVDRSPAAEPESRSGGGSVTESLEPLPRTEQSSSGEVGTLDSASPDPSPSGGRSSSSGASSDSSSSRRTPSGSSLAKDRSVIRDARQTVRVERSEVAAAAGKVSQIVADQDGYVASSSVSETGSSRGAEFEIVVPSARLDATIAAIGRIGKPVRLVRSSVDVTDQRASIDDRLRDLRADRSSVRLQLARATDADRRAAKRRELRLLSSRIARLEGEQRELRGQVSTARLSLRLTTARGGTATSAADDDGRWGLSDAWDDAGRVLQVVGGVLLIAAVILLPLAALVGLVVLGRRRLTANRKNRTIGDA